MPTLRPLPLLLLAALAAGPLATGARAQQVRPPAAPPAVAPDDAGYERPPEPGTPGQALFVRALTAQQLGDHAEAETILENLLTLHPDDPALLAALAESERAQGRLPDALLHLGRAAERAPTEPSVLEALAALQAEAGLTADAAATYERLLRLRPRDRAALDALARVHQGAGQPREALDALERLLQIDDRPATRLRIADLHVRLGAPAQALAGLVEGAARHPADGPLALRVALAYRDAGRPDSAAAVLDRRLARAPGDADAAVLRASLSGAPPRADDADAPADRLRRAAALAGGGEADPTATAEARRLAAPLADAPDASFEALRTMAAVETAEGDHAAAAAYLDRALALNARDVGAWADAVDAHRLAGDTDTAARTADDALVLFPGQPALLAAAAEAYAAAGRAADARARAAEALGVLDPTDPASEGLRSRLLRLSESL